MNKYRPGFFLLLFLLLIALAFALKPGIVGVVANSLKVPNRVNVVLIVVDALRADHLSIFGYDRNTSPRIERVAQEGTVFESAYTHVPLTLPTFTTMLTSLYPYSHRVLTPFKGPSPKAVTLAEILQKHGWQTGAVVGASNLDSDLGLSQGFQFYDDAFPQNADSIIFQHRNKVEYERRAEEVNHLVFKWLDRVRKSKNFFILIHYIDPHFPYTPPLPFDRAYHNHDDQDQNSRWIDMYDGEVAYTDKNVGELSIWRPPSWII
jgi:arylsulfatase A-like enzyme